jgi:hypothetical protein
MIAGKPLIAVLAAEALIRTPAKLSPDLRTEQFG